MTRTPGIGSHAYARRIERALAEVREGPVVLSPRDWRLISEWYERNIPLAVVLESLEAAAAAGSRSRSALARGGLGVVARAVDEAWRTIREGLASGAHAGPGPAGETVAPIEAWRATCRRTSHLPLARLLEELVHRFERGEPAAALDQALDARLDEACEPGVAAAARAAARDELASYRERMSAEAFATSLRRAVVDRLRRDLGLPRLAM